MIPIPGELIALLTFPSVIVHEAAHMVFCKWSRVAVFDVCYFRFGNPAGYVIHEPAKNFHAAFLIAEGPFIINSLLCILICFPAFVPVRIFEHTDIVSFFLLWLGVSIGMHAFPSNQDAKVLWGAAKVAAARFNPLAILSFPIVAIIFVANVGSMLWLDALYGFAIGILLPELVFKKIV
jgi:hypothetical protein